MLQFAESIEPTKILTLLSRSVPYYLKAWKDFDDECGLFGTTDPSHFNMKSIGTSSPVIEYVILPHIHILCILAAFVQRDALSILKDHCSSEGMRRYINKGIMWLCNTHITGNTDVSSFLTRKRWGENWRSGKWAALLGLCAFMCKDILKEELYKRVLSILAFEADRFIKVSPPTGYAFDTKLEENALDVMVLAWAINLLPEHSHRHEWNRVMQIWALNIATSPDCLSDHTEFFDKSRAHWITTQTLYPDFTAENHGFFNPDVLTYGMWLVLSKAAFTFLDNETPEVFNNSTHQKVFDILLRFCLPNGMLYAPGSNDFPLFIPRPFALAWGLWNNDSRSQRVTACTLNWMANKLLQSPSEEESWIPGFEHHYEGWELLFQSQVGFELALLAALPFKKEQPLYTIGQIENTSESNHLFPFIQICHHRNTRITRSLAWKALGKHPVIGINVHSNSEILVPYKANLLGIPSINESISSWDVAYHYECKRKNGFDSYGRINYFSPQGKRCLIRDMRVVTWGDDGLIVFDKIVANAHIRFEEQYLSPLYLVNDHWTNNTINLQSGSLQETIKTDDIIKRHISCPSHWASIEHNILVQLIWGRDKGLTYIPGNKRNAPRYWNNCRLDMLALYVEGKDCSPGDTAYEIGFFIGVGKGPRSFKYAGACQDFFKGLVIMDGKNTLGFD